MNPELSIRKRRNFGDTITDPFKLIFRNIKGIFAFNMVYIFLPMAFALGSLSYVQAELMLGKDIPIVITIIGLISVFISSMNVYNSTYAIVKSAEVNGFEKVKFSDIQAHFSNKFIKNLLFVFVVSIFFGLIVGLIFLLLSVSVVLMVLIYVLLMFAVVLYFLPMLYMAYNVYMYESDKDFSQAFSKAREYLSDHWGLIFGTLIVTGIVYSMLSNSFSIPFMLVGFMMMDFSEIIEGQTQTFTAFSIVQQTIAAFFTSFLAQYIGISMFFKYFDLEERQYGYKLLERIDAIGETKESYFENEGEY